MARKRRESPDNQVSPQVTTLRKALDDNDYTWKVSSQWGPNATEIVMACEHATYEVVVRDDGSTMTSYCEFPTLVPPQRHVALAEAITRTNWELRDRNFDLSFDQNTITLRSSIYHGRARMTPGMAVHLAVDCTEVAEQFYPAFMKVAYSDACPEAAVMEAIFRPDED